MQNKNITYALLLLSPIVVFIGSMLVGSFELTPTEIYNAAINYFSEDADTSSTVVVDIRLPRVLTAALCGMAISVSGVSLQGVLRNPLVDPYILGLSSGAAFGAALSIVALPWLPLQLSAFIFALISLALTYSMATTKGETPIVALVLSGVITSSLFTALLSILQIMAHERSLQSIVLWIMGTFNKITWNSLTYVWLPILLGCATIYALRWRLNVISLGDREAAAVGMPVQRYRFIFVVLAALIAAVAVSVAGVIALVGLIVPHMARMIFGPDHTRLVPASAALGASFMMLVDDVARGATEFEIPLSIITTLVGAPFFWLLLRQTRSGSWS